LIKLLKYHKSLGGLKGDCTSAAAADLLAQAEHIESYFARWNTLEGLVHVLASEHTVYGLLPEMSSKCIEQWGATLADAMPRMPTAAALEGAKAGMKQFALLSEDERMELPGTLPWLLFSPTTRAGATNPIFAQVEAFAAGSLNPATSRPYPYRCWHGLTRVLVAGGAKYCPTTSAQIESLFNGLTRQQGNSKVHISQPQISFEARCKKNPTMELLTVPMLNNGWEEAKAAQHVLNTKGFWSCDITLAANRMFAKKLQEEVEINAGGDDGEPAVVKYNVEQIVRAERKVAGQERTYVVKWVGYPTDENTIEPESHLITCKGLLTYWRGKKNRGELERVTKLQQAALQECEEARRRRVEPLHARAECAPTATTTSGTAATTSIPRPADASASCKASYDRVHGCLSDACCLVFDTETSGFGGCVLQLGWILASTDGAELASYEKLWQLPDGERIHSRAFKAHGITAARLRQDGVKPKPELAEFLALIAAALAAGVRVVAHNASFDVRHLNHTANVQKLPALLRTASMLCTMHGATRHCGLRTRGNKAMKAPRNEELYVFLFKRKPAGQLHSALPDCRVTLTSFIEGHKRKWW
jgi:DNA polymerase-3 subunit epsilon